jgi:anti-sigma regulatory factor (Ser/Thr protein kinase)
MATADLTGPEQPISPAPFSPASIGPAPSPTGGMLLEQGFDEDSLYRVRAAVAAHVATVADGRAVETVVLIAHELASNAVRHGGGSGRLRLWVTDDALHCEVSDGGAGLANPAAAGQQLPAPSLPGGRGLWIARQLSELHIAVSPAGTAITATLPLHSERRASPSARWNVG